MKKQNFLGANLRLARVLNGLTLNELGDAVTASRQFIHQLEGDIRQPPEDLLRALCETLSVLPEFFSIEIYNDVKFEQCHFRKRKTTPISLANRVCAYSTIFERLISFISNYIELPKPNFPETHSTSRSYSNLEIEQAAEACRVHWKLGLDAPIKSITRTLENAGVVITTFSGVSEKVDALSLNRKHPIIIRNDAKESPCRLRFDLVHECGHFILHDGVETGDTVTESEADKFASAFIFPRSAFVKEFPRNFIANREASWRPLYELKRRWGMSLKALIYRAHYLNFISAQQYRAANVRLTKTGQSRNENFDDDIPKERPELLENALKLLNNELGITFSKIANHLHITEKMLSNIAGISIPKEISKNIEPFFGRK